MDILDLYAIGDLNRNLYVRRSLRYDNEINKAEAERNELIKRIPILHKDEIIEVSVGQYCEAVRARLEQCSDFDSKRQFVLDHIEKIVFTNDHVAVYGSVPVKLPMHEASNHSGETTNIGFSIDGFVDRIGLSRSVTQTRQCVFFDKDRAIWSPPSRVRSGRP
jgi:hypothetical protein